MKISRYRGFIGEFGIFAYYNQLLIKADATSRMTFPVALLPDIPMTVGAVSLRVPLLNARRAVGIIV